MLSKSLTKAYERIVRNARLAATVATGRFVIKGSSMEPTLFEGQRVLVCPLIAQDTIFRGDVVLAKDPRFNKGIYIKRIIGLPGDHVRIRDGLIYINNKPLEKSYLKHAIWPVHDQVNEWLLFDNQYLIFGDNYKRSSDSRSFGPVNRQQILGLVWLSYWPPKVWGRLNMQKHTSSLRQSI